MNGRVIALDVGEKRIGVATCDPSGIVVRPVGVVSAQPHDRAIAELHTIVRDEEAVLLLVGLPLTLRGEEGPQAQRVLQFVEALKAAIDVPVLLRDERYTSTEAERIIAERGGKRRGKRNQRRGEVDQIAATLILQDYLNEQHMQRSRLFEDVDDSDHACM